MSAPTVTPEQQRGCGYLVAVFCALFGLPLSVVLWKWALVGWCR